MRRDHELEATIVEKYAAVEAFLDERGRRIWAATESRAIGYGGDALVSDATGLSRPTIRAGRRELDGGGAEPGRVRRAGAGRPNIEQSQPGIKQALERLVDPLTRGDPQSPLRWTCKSRAKLTAALSKGGWKVSLNRRRVIGLSQAAIADCTRMQGAPRGVRTGAGGYTPIRGWRVRLPRTPRAAPGDAVLYSPMIGQGVVESLPPSAFIGAHAPTEGAMPARARRSV